MKPKRELAVFSEMKSALLNSRRSFTLPRCTIRAKRRYSSKFYIFPFTFRTLYIFLISCLYQEENISTGIVTKIEVRKPQQAVTTFAPLPPVLFFLSQVCNRRLNSPRSNQDYRFELQKAEESVICSVPVIGLLLQSGFDHWKETIYSLLPALAAGEWNRNQVLSVIKF